MAIRAGMSLLEMIAQLTRGFVKATGRQPSGLENIKIKQEAIKRFEDMNKVVDLEGNVIDTSKGIMGGKQRGATLKSGIMKATGTGPKKVVIKGLPDKEFKDLRTSFRLGIAKNSSDFNQDLADKIIKREVYPDLSDAQRKDFLDNLDFVLKNPRDGSADGGRIGLSYLLAEDTNERMPFLKGKIVKEIFKKVAKPKVKPKTEMDKIREWGVKEMEYTNPKSIYYDERRVLQEKYPGITDDLLNKILIDDNPQRKAEVLATIDEAFRMMEKGKGHKEIIEIFKSTPRTKNAEGGITRVPFSMGRRAFLKLMGAAGAGIGAAKAGLGSLFKAGKPVVAKELTSIPIKNVEGMPSWFKPLVNKVIKEGDDVTEKFATKEREIIHKKRLGDPRADDVYADEVIVTQDLDTGHVRVEYHAGTNMGEAPIQLDYMEGMEVISHPTIKKTLTSKYRSTKEPPTFQASEAEPRVVNWDGDIEWDGENVVGKVDELLSDTTQLEAYATGKRPPIKKLLESEKKQKKVQRLMEDQGNQIDYIETKYGPGPDPTDFDDWPGPEYASGGLAKMLGE
jgi:hypothetical protein